MIYFWLILPSIVVVLLFYKWRRPANFPPGPWALPIVGNFMQVNYSNPLPDLEKLARKYGNVYSIFLGNKLIVVLNGFQTVKDALVKHAATFSDRPKDPVFQKMNKGKGVGTVTNGEQWKEQRKFALTLLRNFGVGKVSMETKILEEAKHLLQFFEDKNDCQFDLKNVINNAMSNVICSILFGQRFDYYDNTFRRQLRLLDETLKLIGGFWGELYNAVPIVRCLPLPFQKLFRNIQELQGFLKTIIQEHKNTLIPGKERDFIDCYLDEINKRNNDGSSFDEENLLMLMEDLFIGATDTTANTMRWALLLMMAYPNVQEKCYEEIKFIANNKEFVSYGDRLRMPYTHAVVHEIQLFGNIIPLALPHGVSEDISFRGYLIPQGTRVIVNLTSVLHDETQWKFPHEFNPTNFLNDSGEFVKQEAFIPFSTGSYQHGILFMT
ncbi:cytochrome P450 2J6-like isoform X2 [Protopterus annectens]|uniref:cytochrome P450 2J6-like isoform X2 n=1 Tax=Protopterus annectens TaxID=7888 RepID=UPI001CF9844D|nr:cytochrome P450 2J6-like isoform X2 [Protopterus annectens]